MEKIRFDVVALQHCDVRDYWKEYATQAVGKQLILQRQTGNVMDRYAIRAREKALHVGYVAVPDQEWVYQAMKGSGKQRLRGVVVESNPEPPVLTVEAEVERVDWDYNPFDDSPFEGWHYDGISLIPPKMEKLGDLAADIIDELEQGSVNPDAMQKMVSQLLKSNLYDVSRELASARYRIERLLAAQQDERLREMAVGLRHQKGMLMRHMYRDQVARYLFIAMPQQLRQKDLEKCHYTHDNRLDQLEQQLRLFPFHLYDKFLSDPVDFLREVYYNHVPRERLFTLLSGIVLMILKGRVSIKSWGREGDTEPIRQIQELAQPLCPSDREQTIRESLRELLNKRNAREHLIISQKNQWAGIMSVLVFEYNLTEIDMKAFCRKMEEWGFGEDGDCQTPCLYDSLSKSSDYATHPFQNWQGSGIAHQRQVLAATELRAILRPKIGRK